jgi:hypothetical protein
MILQEARIYSLLPRRMKKKHGEATILFSEMCPVSLSLVTQRFQVSINSSSKVRGNEKQLGVRKETNVR